MDEVYGMGYFIRSFAISNRFVTESNKVCHKLGGMLKPFGFYTGDAGVLDFASFAGLAGGKTIEDEVSSYRRDAYLETGIYIDADMDASMKRFLLFDYLLSISICYVEVPKYITKGGLPMQSYDKCFCTRNPAIMAAWMGCQPAEMQVKYTPRIQLSQLNFNDRELKFVKLNATAKGNTITVPRSKFGTDKMTCIPLYMLHAFVDGVVPVLKEGIVEFTYRKDNGTLRQLVSTLNMDILNDYYHDVALTGSMLALTDIDTVEQGGMKMSSKMHRGYVKLPELGASRYDETGVRSLNLARVTGIRKLQEADRTFIDVDLNSVIASFNQGVDYLITNPVQGGLGVVYEALTGEKCKGDTDIAVSTELLNYVDTTNIVLSTTFHRSLHMFMVAHPEWFPFYTGKPNKGVSAVPSSNLGVKPMEF